MRSSSVSAKKGLNSCRDVIAHHGDRLRVEVHASLLAAFRLRVVYDARLRFDARGRVMEELGDPRARFPQDTEKKVVPYTAAVCGRQRDVHVVRLKVVREIRTNLCPQFRIT